MIDKQSGLISQRSDQPRINLMTDSNSIQCECDSIFFVESFLLRKVSKLIAGSPEDIVQPVPVYRCQDCGAVVKDLVPRFHDLSEI